MAKFMVTFEHRGYFDVEVSADTEEDAIKIAEKKYEDTDFDPLCFADGGLYSVEHENGDIVYFK